jgi:hypothetical protein
VRHAKSTLFDPPCPALAQVFKHCTAILLAGDELAARDLYWRGVQEEAALAPLELEGMFRRATELNPYVAEPHIMLSQVRSSSALQLCPRPVLHSPSLYDSP